MTSTLQSPLTALVDDSAPAPSLDRFASLSHGDPAPYWLFTGITTAWGIDPSRARIDLITVSENAIFLLYIDGTPEGVIRVSQPGYVGGPAAVASEITWLNALHDIDGINLINPVPTIRGTFVTQIRDDAGVGWMCMSSKYVPGTVLENLTNPAPYYRTIGAWAALFHHHARHWTPPAGFTRFSWDISNMVGPSPRWGRWEDAALTAAEHDLCTRALWAALDHIIRIPRTPDTWGLIHADLRPSNVIAGPDGTLTVIDFDDSGYSWYLYDYAASLSFVEHTSYGPELAKAWVAGYEATAGTLPEQDLDTLSALSMIRRLQMLGWTTNHRADALPGTLAAEQAPGTVDIAARYLANPRWLLT